MRKLLKATKKVKAGRTAIFLRGLKFLRYPNIGFFGTQIFNQLHVTASMYV